MAVPTKAGTPSLSSLQAALRKSSSPKPGSPAPEQGVKRSLSASASSDGEPPAKRHSSAAPPTKPSIAKAPIVKTGGNLQGKSSGLTAKQAGAPAPAPGPAVTQGGAFQKAKPPGPAVTKAPLAKMPGANVQRPAASAVNGGATTSKAPSQDHAEVAEADDGVPAAIVSLVASINDKQGNVKLRHLLRLAGALTANLQIDHFNYFCKALKKKLADRAQRDGVGSATPAPAAQSTAAPRTAPAAQSTAAPRTASAVKSTSPIVKTTIPVKAKGPPGAAPPVKQPAVAKVAQQAPPAPAVAAAAPSPPSSPPPQQVAPTPPPSPQSSGDLSNDPLFALVGELTEDPVCADGLIIESRLTDVLQRLWNGVARRPKDWIAAWQALMIPVERQCEALQKFLNMAFVQTEGHEGETAPMIVAELTKAHKVKLRSVEEVMVAFGRNLDGILAMNEEAWHVYAFFLTHIFPKPANTGWGWSRVGWSWQSWWQFAEKCIGSLEPSKAFDVVAMVLRLVQEREGSGLAQVPTWTEGERLKKVIHKLGELGGCSDAEVFERLGAEGIMIDTPVD